MLEAYPWMSLLPAIVAVVLVFGTRQVILPLLMGVVVAVGLLQGANPLAIALETQRRLVAEIADPSNAAVLLLLLLVGGFVSLLQATGAPQAFIQRFVRVFHTARSARMLVVVSGMFLFFSDSASPLLRGPMLIPLFDQLRQSREKLAFLLDATAAPISSIVPISPWTTVVAALVAKQFAELQLDSSPIELVLTALPYQFYTIAILTLAFATAWFDLSFGEMQKADAAAADRLKTTPGTSSSAASPMTASPWTLVISLVALTGTLTIVMFAPALGLITESAHRNILSGSMPGITLGFAVSSLYLAGVLGRRQHVSTLRIQKIWLRGAFNMSGVILILLLAWSLGSCMLKLGTGSYMAGLCRETVPPAFTPLVIFLVSSAASFVNGTAWGCYALFIPIAVPIGIEMNLDMPLILGAVVGGSLVGDQCSPFSDTTILSSASAGCDHLRHVRTQLPYAFLATGIAIVTIIVTTCFSLLSGYCVMGFLLIGSIALIHSRKRTSALHQSCLSSR